MENELDVYPSLDDPMFNVKISNKKEFNDTSFDGTVYKNIAERAEILSQMPFEISSHQLFVKSFLSFLTPYNSLLLYHGLGTGKTCSAIGAAEDMRQYLKQFNINKSIVIVASPNVQQNFKLQLFDESKLVQINGSWEFRGCVGNAIINEINPTAIKNYPREKVIQQIKHIISKNYTFLGYIQFSNLIEKLSENMENLKREFNGRLVIIDEYHNMRTIYDIDDAIKKGKKKSGEGKTEKGKKRVKRSKKLKQTSYQLDVLVENADNLRLLLLSATPMYNSYKEIIWTLNLLNKNDKRQTIKERDIFEADGSFKPDGVENLVKASRGYISFVKGDNPYVFPFRVYPQKPLKIPNIQLNGVKIPRNDRMSVLNKQITFSQINETQNQIYQYILNFTVKKNPHFDTMSGFKYTDLQLPIQALNITYPFPSDHLPDVDTESSEEDFPDFPLSILVGTEGLKRVMRYRDTSANKNEFEYRPEYNHFFNQDNIGKYSSKIKDICNKITTSVGVVLVYSNYLDGGLIPLALALEELGIQRIDKTKNLFKTPPTPFTGLSYAMITGDTRISPNNTEEVNICTGISNTYGDTVKVIMITTAGAEGIDLKYIRQVHIMDPWYNMNRIEQIIGRAVRNFSHKDLPFEERNVEIFLYATKLLRDEEKHETIDLYMYRKAEQKALQMGKITRILKENSVDCLLNYQQNNFTHANMVAEGIGFVKQVLSDNTVIKKFPVGDMPYSVNCDFMEQCEYVCRPYESKEEYALQPKDVNENTYDEHYIKMNTASLQKKIMKLFEESYFYNFDDIYKKLLQTKVYSNSQIYYALDNIINNAEPITDRYGRPGFLVNVGQYYVFQPKELNNVNLGLFERYHPIEYKRHKLNIPLKEKFLKPLQPEEAVAMDENRIVPMNEMKASLGVIQKLTDGYNRLMKYNRNPERRINKEDEYHYDRYAGKSIYLLNEIFSDSEDYYQIAVSCAIDMMSYDEKVALLYDYVDGRFDIKIADYVRTHYTEENSNKFIEKQKLHTKIKKIVDVYFEEQLKKIGDDVIYVMYRWNPEEKTFKLLPKIITPDKEIRHEMSYDTEQLLLEELRNEKISIDNRVGDMLGYISYDVKKNDYFYKIVELTKKRNTGRFCYQKSKKDVVEDMKRIIPEDLYETISTHETFDKFQKEEYCVFLMLLTRILNKMYPDRVWYLSFERYLTMSGE